MSARCITDPAEADADWLTEVLLEAGALRDGHVVAVARDCQSSSWSRSVWLEPRYEAGASGERPRSLLLKICAGPFGPSEYHYYTRDYRGYAVAPLVRYLPLTIRVGVPSTPASRTICIERESLLSTSNEPEAARNFARSTPCCE